MTRTLRSLIAPIALLLAIAPAVALCQDLGPPPTDAHVATQDAAVAQAGMVAAPAPIIITPARIAAPPDASAPIVTNAPASTAPTAIAVPDPAGDPTNYILTTYQAAESGNWRMFVASLLVGLVFVLRKAAGSKRYARYIQTDRGGALLVLVLGVLGAIVHALAAGQLSGKTLVAGITTAIMASGGYTLIRRIIWPSDATDAPAPGQ